MALALFDLDNTLLNGDSDQSWGNFLCTQGVVDPELHRATNEQFYQDYQNGVLDIMAFLEFALKPLAEIEPTQLFALRDQFMQAVIEPMIQPKALALIEKHKKQGDVLVIITATNRFVTELIAERHGIEHLIATEPEQLDGRYTGKLSGTPCFQEGKITRLNQWLADHPELNLEGSYFYSDSHNDLPLLRQVEFPYAVDPDDTLREASLSQNWPILSLRSS